jgi:hypothetical protein
MLPPTAAVRRAASVELRAIFSGLRCAAKLLRSAGGGAATDSLAAMLARAAARGERALARLERSDP